MSQLDWWRDAVIYQIYPRSFKDSSGDGVGDIRGIIDKLDYIASLRVDAIWVSPMFKSPMKDFGYDIADYRDIDPLFGTLEEFDQLIAEAHRRNIKVIIDQVLSHTSDQHPWFVESREDSSNTKADWYVWADAKADGTAPNNWLAIFGGPAWQWEPRRQQYYLHNFLASQPDLNFFNPEVQAAVLDNVEFWLKRGIDGLRLDAINFCFHDRQLRDNPVKPVSEREGRGFNKENPYAYQRHLYNNTQVENLGFVEKIRQLLNRYPGTFAVGEVSSEDSIASMAEYTAGNSRLHTAYSFELLTDDFSAHHIRTTVSRLENKFSQGWPCWAISNHDVARAVSRWGESDGEYSANNPKAKMLLSLLCSLRGTLCCYQGEELGLPESKLAYHELQDPYGIAFWPRFKGRDNCRTPLPWQQHSEHGGFSQQNPWLPVSPEHLPLAVDSQEAQPHSVLNYFKNFIHWRKAQPALRWGSIEFIELPEPYLAFYRCYQEQTLLLVFNLSAQKQSLDIATLGVEAGKLKPCAAEHRQMADYYFANSLEQGKISLSSYGFCFAEIDKK